MIKIRPQTIHKHPALQILMWLGFTLPFVMIVLGGMGLVGNWLMMITGFWGLTFAAVLLLWANNNGVKNAFKTRQISQTDYAHWNKRTYCGLGLFGIACLYVTFAIGQEVIVKKENLTITAVPTPELMAQMKEFLNEPDVAHTEVEFNGQAQEITFYTQKQNAGAIEIMIDTFKQKYDYPEFKVNNRNLTPDYEQPYEITRIDYLGEKKCYLLRKLKSKVNSNETYTHVEHNLPIQSLDTFIINDQLAIDFSMKFKTRTNQDECYYFYTSSIKDESFRVQAEEFRSFVYPLIYYPVIANNISTVSKKHRLSLVSWKNLNGFH
ncbi:hypothetical protein HR060_17240 [Catenovulum sp. SM1970]|uniref:hypothetical protein n=1 Tax=Marinifaba aquimaris TaxID=2741323 RepID=UPI0015746049|nr:hypothetical protein [Marinifaba aquimaris]NTS78591.1 hypothetical protein [Marinifaba aquimaris]